LLDKIVFTVIFASPIATIRPYRPPANNTTIKSVQGSGFGRRCFGRFVSNRHALKSTASTHIDRLGQSFRTF
jgi:hypothetical protein